MSCDTGFFRPFIPSAVQEKFQKTVTVSRGIFGIAKQVGQKVITLSPEALTLVELIVVLSLDIKLVALT